MKFLLSILILPALTVIFSVSLGAQDRRIAPIAVERKQALIIGNFAICARR